MSDMNAFLALDPTRPLPPAEHDYAPDKWDRYADTTFDRLAWAEWVAAHPALASPAVRERAARYLDSYTRRLVATGGSGR